MRSEEFQNFVRSTSQAMLAGMQCYQSFEDLPNGRNGEIGVIGIVSDKTLALGKRLVLVRRFPKENPIFPSRSRFPARIPRMALSNCLTRSA